MKKTKRILCALLAVMLILPMALVNVNAASTYESVEDLGWTVNTTNGLYTNPGAVATEIVTDFGTTGNKALHFVGSTSDWNGYNIVSADAMAGVTQYTAKVTVCYTGATKLGFHLNNSDPSSSKGDWASIDWTTTLENRTHTGSAWENDANVAGVVQGSIATLTANVNLDTQTITVTYSDGVNADVTSTRSTNTTETGAVVFAVRQLNAYVDDIVITNDATGAVIYSEDFEGFTVEAEEETTVLPAGTVLYENDFDDGNTYASNTVTASDLGWREIATGGTYASQGKYTYALVAPLDGSAGAAAFVGTTSGNSSVEMYSAAKMQAAYAEEAFTSYVISADVAVIDTDSGTNCGWFGFQFAYDDSASEGQTYAAGASDLVLLARRGWNSFGMQIVGTNAAGSSWKNVGDSAGLRIGATQKVKIEIDVVNGVARSYINDVMIEESTNNQFKTIGAVAVHSCYISGVIDNFTITRGTIATPGTEITSQTYDALATGRKLLPATKYYNGTTTDKVLASAGIVTENGDNSLHIVTPFRTNGTWQEGAGVELVPASAIQNVEQYTIQFSLKAMKSYSTSMWLPFGDGSTHRVRIGLYGSGFFVGSNISSFTQDGNLDNTLLGQEAKIAIEIDAKNGTGKVSVVGTTLSHVIMADTVLGAVDFVCGLGQEVYIDDVIVTAGGYADEPATYIGAQETAVDNGTYNVRFVASLGNQFEYTDYENVGLKITCGNKTWDTPCRYVYDSVTGGENVGNLETYSASTYGAKYLMAYTIKGIPADAGELTFTVTPYFETEAGTAYGTSYNVVYNQGAFVSSTIAH